MAGQELSLEAPYLYRQAVGSLWAMMSSWELIRLRSGGRLCSSKTAERKGGVQTSFLCYLHQTELRCETLYRSGRGWTESLNVRFRQAICWNGLTSNNLEYCLKELYTQANFDSQANLCDKNHAASVLNYNNIWHNFICASTSSFLQAYFM